MKNHFGATNFNECVDLEANLIPTEVPSEESILTEVIAREGQQESDEESVSHAAPPSRTEASAARETWQKFLEAQENGLNARQSLLAVEEYLTQLNFTIKKQTVITDFFMKS